MKALLNVKEGETKNDVNDFAATISKYEWKKE